MEQAHPKSCSHYCFRIRGPAPGHFDQKRFAATLGPERLVMYSWRWKSLEQARRIPALHFVAHGVLIVLSSWPFERDIATAEIAESSPMVLATEESIVRAVVMATFEGSIAMVEATGLHKPRREMRRRTEDARCSTRRFRHSAWCFAAHTQADHRQVAVHDLQYGIVHHVPGTHPYRHYRKH